MQSSVLLRAHVLCLGSRACRLPGLGGGHRLPQVGSSCLWPLRAALGHLHDMFEKFSSKWQ